LAYDQALSDYFDPYHQLIDLLVRVAVNQQCLSESVVNLSATVACEGVPLHMVYFAKLWYDIYMSETVDRRYIEILCASIPFLEYVSTVLLEERTSLNNLHIHQFFCNFFSRVRIFTCFDAYFVFICYHCCYKLINRAVLNCSSGDVRLKSLESMYLTLQLMIFSTREMAVYCYIKFCMCTVS
jgi:hypothetical protein